jgi:AraC-like DNA-binding protein
VADRRERAQVLRPAIAAERIRIGRAEPPAELGGMVDYLWWVSWETPEPYAQDVAPRPVVHLAAEIHEGEPRLLVHGVPTERFERKLSGAGRTVAAAFRPGGFRPFVAVDVATLTDRIVPVDRLFGVDDRPVAADLLDPAIEPEAAAGRLAGWLVALDPTPDPHLEQLASLVERVERDPSLRRAEQLADLAGVSLRTLQRRFRSYVGVSPKWVVQRYRLLDVLEQVHGREDVDWATLADELGYADQSHLIRHFTALVGEPPARYRASDTSTGRCAPPAGGSPPGREAERTGGAG